MTLNDAAKYTKRGIAYFLLFMVLYMVGDGLYRGANYIYDKTFPKPIDPPNVVFGKVKQLEIQTLPIDLSEVEYRKSFANSELIEIPKQVRVYKIESPIISPAKEELFKQRAQNLGFASVAKKISDTKRIWINNVNQSQFEVEVYFKTFSLYTNPIFLESRLVGGQTPLPSSAVDATKLFFSKNTDLGTLINNADYSIKSAYIQEGLIKETKLPDKEILKYVNVVPKEIGYTNTVSTKRGNKIEYEEVPVQFNIIGKNPDISNINAYVGIDTSQNNSSTTSIYYANFNYYKQSINYGVYPIISVNKAWDSLNLNQASLVYIKEDGADFFAPSENIKNLRVIDIEKIYLAYFMDTKFMDYMQPIYVFKGRFTTLDERKGSLYFYLPALDEQLVTTK